MSSGSSSQTGTDGSDNLNGGSGDDSLSGGAGNDFLNGGSGADILNGGSGSDTLNGGSGNDTLVYNVAENSGSVTNRDVYTGGSGKDTVQIEFTLNDWLDPANYTQVQNYLAHLAKYVNAKTGELSNGSASDFTFTFGSSSLTVQMIEQLKVYVDGFGVIDLAGNDKPLIFSQPANATLAETDSALSGSGTVVFADVDIGDTPEASSAFAGASGRVLTPQQCQEAVHAFSVTPAAGACEGRAGLGRVADVHVGEHDGPAPG